MNKSLKEEYRDDPKQAVIDALLDVIEDTQSPSARLEAIKMVIQIHNEQEF